VAGKAAARHGILSARHRRRQPEEFRVARVPARTSQPAQCWARALSNLADLDRQTWASLSDLVDERALRFADRPALTSPGEVLTYRGLAAAKNQYANWAAHRHIAAGETICLLMRNCPSFLAIWLGLTQAGACVALINTNLRGDALLQSLSSVQAKNLIVDHALLPLLDDLRPRLPQGCAIWVHGQAPDSAAGLHHLNPADYSPQRATIAEAPPIDTDATALLIFTSGTTGLPKAARLSHYRLLEWSLWFAGMMDTDDTDILYNCLPMYHSTGGVAAIGGVLANGGTVAIRERFSARRFWADIVDEKCTIFLYIGELCRYLVNAPFDEHETRHQLRLCCGNGLRAEVWQAFQARFNSPAILEFYASTEGNVSLYNCEGQPGAIGRVPAFLAHRFPTAIIECDTETGDIRRDADGRCLRCAPDAVGEAIGLIADGGKRGTARFEGYTDAAATERKILRNVFTEGDAWFRTGDLMRRDAAGFFYFVDRMGDTFRWKGENVSTTQVAEILATYPGISEAIVYGVHVEGEEGRACMAALTTTPDFAIDALPAFLDRHLPPYARPMFLRLCSHIETTGTFKPVKTALIREAYDTAQMSDPVFRYEGGEYKRIRTNVK
jgi:fatty-acyl-CoA synthase